MTLIPCNHRRRIQHNANGQFNHVGQREYVWDVLGRLPRVCKANNGPVSYG